MSNEVKIQKTSGGVVHAGQRMVGYFTPNCGSGVVYAPSSFRQIARFRELPETAEVTCKKCLKLIARAEELGLHLQVRKNEDGSSRVVDTRKEESKTEVVALEEDETTPAGMFDPELTYFADGTRVVMRARGEEQRGVTIGKTVKAGGPYAFQAVRFDDGTTANVAPHVLHRVEEAPVPTTVADQLAQVRANREAEEEARAAERRARNRVNYAPKPEPTEAPAHTERKVRTFTFEYNASEGVLIAAALREKAVIERDAAKAYRTNAEIEGTSLVDFYTEQARLADNRAKLLEDAAERMHKPVREAVAKAVEKAIPVEPEPKFHRQVKDAIGLRW